MSFVDRLTNRLFKSSIERQVRQLLYTETDAVFTIGASAIDSTNRDRYTYDRDQVFEKALEAWRVNPLARRIVGLTTQYVVGGGIAVNCKHEPTANFIKQFWDHRLNRMDIRIFELCDELIRTGNLFILLSTDAAGQSYIRAVPASQIASIESQPNDFEQPITFTSKASADNLDPKPWKAYDQAKDGRRQDGRFETVMLHYAVNRPVGAQWGESDLAPVLRWLSRYANWLEDRARLNRFRTAFLYVVKGKFASSADRVARQNQLNANPPSPGSILVTDDSETWDILSPKLESAEASTDGLGLKKMIAAGSGVPMHFLAEPESSTRTTAEAAGGPTYRHYEQRQKQFLWIICDLLNVVINRRSLVDPSVDSSVPIEALGADISARDNVALGLAAANINNVIAELRDRGLIDDAEYLRFAYRFAGETLDVEDMLRRGKAAPKPILDPDRKKRPLPRQAIQPDTGEPKKASREGGAL
jgi:hypothetical protein